jgi:hypothetical protein
MTPMNKIKIVGIETDSCTFLCNVSDRENACWSSGPSSLKSFVINGQKPDDTYDKLWVSIPGKLNTVQKFRVTRYTNHRYELQDASLASEKIPLVISPSDSVYDGGSKCDDEWGPQYAMYRSLYVHRYDTEPPVLGNVEFEYFKLFDIPDLKQYQDFHYPIKPDKGGDVITNKSVKYQEIDKIVFPAPILPSRPQKLTSKESYDIIRKHIQNNISPSVARITSDYDFCFTVKKKIPLAKPYKIKTEITTPRGNSYKRPKYNDFLVDEKEVQIFEMTSEKDNYKGYTPVKGFEGKDQDDLRLTIDNYLEELMAIINEPVKQCEHCGGCGVVFNKVS